LPFKWFAVQRLFPRFDMVYSPPVGLWCSASLGWRGG